MCIIHQICVSPYASASDAGGDAGDAAAYMLQIMMVAVMVMVVVPMHISHCCLR
jgi:hypothetical protein